MSKSIIGNLPPSQSLTPPPAKEKTVDKKPAPPKMTARPAKETSVTPDGRRFKAGLELSRESESDEENEFEDLSAAAQKSSDGGNKSPEKKENAVATTTSAHTEAQAKTAEINSPAHNFENDYARLESAVKAGDIHTVKQLIDQDSRLIAVANRDGTLIYAIDLAIKNKNQELVKILTGNGKEIKLSSGYINYLLSIAIPIEDFKIIKHIIDLSPSISLEFELNSDLLLKLVNLGNPKLVELFLNKLDRTSLDSESFKNTRIADWTGSVLDCAALMAASDGHSEILSLLIKAGAELKRLDLDQAINNTCQFIRLVLTDAITESASEEFSGRLGRDIFMDHHTRNGFINSLKQYASAYAVTGQDLGELTKQQLKMIFLQCVISSNSLHELINAKEQRQGFEEFYIHSGFGDTVLKKGLKEAWRANLLMSAAQLESDRQQQTLKKFLTNLSPSVKTAQLTEAASKAGWHPIVIRMLTDAWTSLGRRKTKENFFAAINARLLTQRWLKKIMALESDAARHIVTLQTDKLKDWIGMPSGDDIVTMPTAQISDQS